MKKLILIDGNALVHRAFHALPPLKAPNGMIANAIFGFYSVLIKTIKELKPDYIAATFDLAAPTFRHEEYEEYKAHREKAPDELYAQMPIIKDILGAFGVPIYEKEGYEADDLIGFLAKKGAKEKDVQVIILTGDFDTLQLVEGEKVMVFTLKKGVADTVLYDEEMVKKRYGGLLPGQLSDFKGLKGDPSDNIPGVPGVGEKTAIMLIQKYGSIENMYKELKKKGQRDGITEKLRQKLIENKDKAIFSKYLSTIVTDIDVDFSLEKTDWVKNFKLGEIERIFKELAFSSLLKRLEDLRGVRQENLVFAPLEAAARKIDIHTIESEEEFKDFLKKARTNQGVSFLKKENTFYFAIDSGNIYEIKDESRATEILKEINLEKITHNAKDALKELLKGNAHLKNIFDTAIAAYLINPDQKDYDFEKIYFQEFQTSPPAEKKYWPAHILKLKNILWEKLKDQELIKVFKDIEMPLIPVLAEMENTGIRVDVESINKLGGAINKELAKLESQIYKKAGANFNINSPQQLSGILFEKLKLKGRVRKTGGGVKSTAAPELEKLIDEHSIIELILQYRELQKLKTTYVEPFPNLVGEDGRIHTTYNQTGTGTGRLASENPNLQNIPIKTELGQEFRKSFVAGRGYKLVSCDYSQLELRIVAHIAKDEKMTEAFKRGEDIHTRTAAEIFDVDPKDVTPKMRRQAKVINFGIIYGMGVLGFARAAGVDRNRAKEFMTKYMEEFSGIAQYIKETKEEVRKTGLVRTPFGRIRKITEVFTTIPEVIRQGDRMAVNFPIQGGEADIVKTAMIKVYDYIHKNYSEGEVKMLLQVHDELLFEVKEKNVKEFSEKVRKIMEGVADLIVPLIVDVKAGNNWAKMESNKI